MMATLDSLYQDLILDHNRRPQNYGRIASANRRIDGDNPLCGDRLTLWVNLSADTIEDLSFEGSGCAISRASASLMTSAVKGKTRSEADALLQQFHQMLTGTLASDDVASLGKLAAFGGVSQFPMRVKCATLCWHALGAALKGSGEKVTTE
jgi:nitrogen fixation NifU-like protein